jgi:hypothetical protein
MMCHLLLEYYLGLHSNGFPACAPRVCFAFCRVVEFIRRGRWGVSGSLRLYSRVCCYVYVRIRHGRQNVKTVCQCCMVTFVVGQAVGTLVGGNVVNCTTSAFQVVATNNTAGIVHWLGFNLRCSTRLNSLAGCMPAYL